MPSNNPRSTERHLCPTLPPSLPPPCHHARASYQQQLAAALAAQQSAALASVEQFNQLLRELGVRAGGTPAPQQPLQELGARLAGLKGTLLEARAAGQRQAQQQLQAQVRWTCTPAACNARCCMPCLP
jgi:hypothetical protein